MKDTILKRNHLNTIPAKFALVQWFERRISKYESLRSNRTNSSKMQFGLDFGRLSRYIYNNNEWVIFCSWKHPVFIFEALKLLPVYGSTICYMCISVYGSTICYMCISVYGSTICYMCISVYRQPPRDSKQGKVMGMDG